MILLITLKNQAVWQIAKWNKYKINKYQSIKIAPGPCFPNSGTERLVDGDNDDDDDDSDDDYIKLIRVLRKLRPKTRLSFRGYEN